MFNFFFRSEFLLGNLFNFDNSGLIHGVCVRQYVCVYTCMTLCVRVYVSGHGCMFVYVCVILCVYVCVCVALYVLLMCVSVRKHLNIIFTHQRSSFDHSSARLPFWSIIKLHGQFSNIINVRPVSF